MGGIFSGRKPSKTTKSLPEQFIALDVRDLQRHQGLESGQAYNLHQYKRDKVCGIFSIAIYEDCLELRYIEHNERGCKFPSQSISIARTPCHFGGYRPWFLCPGDHCGKRVAILYGPHSMLCRHCLGMAYQSQREDQFQRMLRKLRAIEAKYPKPAYASNPETQTRPKGMHHRTFHFLESKHYLQMKEIKRIQIEELIKLEQSLPEWF